MLIFKSKYNNVSEFIPQYFVKVGIIPLFVGVLFILCSCDRARPRKATSVYIEPHCPKISTVSGDVGGDLIHDEHEAKIIGSALIRGFAGTNQKFSAGANVIDIGRWWQINEKLKRGIYGGGINFKLDKCNGAVSDIQIDPE